MAFMELLAGESPYVGLAVGSGGSITLDAMPVQFTAPVTARQTNRLGEDAEEFLTRRPSAATMRMRTFDRVLRKIHPRPLRSGAIARIRARADLRPSEGRPHSLWAGVNADRTQITIGAIGTKHGLDFLRRWLEATSNPVAIPPCGKRDKKFRLHLSDFPGLEEAYGIRADPGALIAYELGPADIRTAIAIENHHEAVAATTQLFIDPIERHAKNEERTVDVWIIIVPEAVFETCRPAGGQRRKLELVKGELSRRQKGRADLPLLAGVIDDTLEAVFDDIPDFHRQIKAKLLKLGMTSRTHSRDDPRPQGIPEQGWISEAWHAGFSATVAWNLATGLFYKTQAEPPWKIAGMRPGVCYVGLVFKLLPNHPDNHACCAAQMFLSEGDGVVFRGANGPWKTEDKEFHLSDLAAEKLIKTVLDTYKLRFGTYPTELFIHGRTKFNDAEWEAFSRAAPKGTNVVGVRIRSTHGETKLFRDGDYPCLRGTAIRLGDKDAFLWTDWICTTYRHLYRPGNAEPAIRDRAARER